MKNFKIRLAAWKKWTGKKEHGRLYNLAVLLKLKNDMFFELFCGSFKMGMALKSTFENLPKEFKDQIISLTEAYENFEIPKDE